MELQQVNFIDWISLTIAEVTGAQAAWLEVEVLETHALSDLDHVTRVLRQLQTMNIKVNLDDFGTGYSSLSYLKRLPLDQLKIDQSFVRDLLTDANDNAIARTIVALADSMGLAVIAEGVETQEQRDCLAGHGCYTYQGYLFGRPVPAEELKLSCL
jgi:EAL domain-containing protein (putative c-di-GMP-specific phosphodiesterase class I)